MYLNTFSDTTEPVDMTALDEYASLRTSAAELGIDAPATVRYLSRNAVFRHQRFHYLEWGTAGAPPVVLLHGHNQSAHAWDLVSLNLAASYHVHALDQRGHGDSEWSRGAHYGIDEMAADAAAFVDQLDIEAPIVVGHSMGGMVTLALACAQPRIARALVIVDIGPEVNERGTRMIREFVGRNIEFDDMQAFLDRVEKYDPYRTRAHMARTVKYNLLRRADGRYVSKADRRRFHAPAKPGEALPGVPSMDQLAHLDMPVLVVRGGDSNVLEQAAAERFAATLPNGQLAVVPDCGHNVASQNTLGFLAALKPFLDQVSS